MSELSMPQCWNKESKPHRFCPGCGHGLVLKALGMAVDELGLAERIVFACDIGCSLLAWDFFTFPCMQAHHGRTIPVMMGLKRASPDRIAVAYMGDGGGYAIGLHHLISSAQRNDPITTILVNNTVYAMTGGQMAPTTLPGQKTRTTPLGRAEGQTGRFFKGPETLASVVHPRAYLSRGTVARIPRLKKMIRQALERQLQGQFSFVEALSTCPVNWRTDAAATWSFLEQEMSSVYPPGEIAPASREDS